MAIRNPKLGGTEFSNGEVLYDYDLDDTFDAVAYRLIDKDDTPVTHNTTTAINAYTVNIGAGEISRFVDINVESRHRIRHDGSGGGRFGANTGIVDVYIGELGSEILIKSFSSSMTGGDDISGSVHQISHKLFYEPTTAEKTNGFNIIFKIRVSGIAADGISIDYASYYSSYIMGA